MRTVTYAVYDGSSGEVVHLHIEAAGMESSPEEIIHMAGKPNAGQLKVVRVPDELAASGSFRVEKGQVRAGKDNQQQGGGGISSPLDGPDIPRKYTKADQR